MGLPGYAFHLSGWHGSCDCFGVGETIKPAVNILLGGFRRSRVWCLAAVLVSLAPVAQAQLITNGLVGYWTGNGNALDTSSQANNGTFAGSYVAGVNGGEAFDLSSGVVTMPDIPAYSLGGSFSVGFWVNLDSTGGGTILGQDNGPGGTSKWFVGYSNFVSQAFSFHLNGPSSDVLSTGLVVLPANGWNYFALTDANGAYNFYLNGSDISSQTFNGAFPDPTANLKFGFAEAGFSFLGELQDVSLFNRPLSSSEVTQMMNVPEPATFALWCGLGSLLCFVRKRFTRK